MRWLSFKTDSGMFRSCCITADRHFFLLCFALVGVKYMWIYHFAETFWAPVCCALCCARVHLFHLSCLSHCNFLTESTQCLLQLRKQRVPDSRCNRSGTMLELVFVWFLYTFTFDMHTLNSFAVREEGEREREKKRGAFSTFTSELCVAVVLVVGSVCLILCVCVCVTL